MMPSPRSLPCTRPTKLTFPRKKPPPGAGTAALSFSSASGLARLDLAGGQLGVGARLLHILGTCQGHAHAALDEALWLAEQAQVRARHGQGLVHAVEHQAFEIGRAHV